MSTEIREEQPGDADAIRRVHVAAFGGDLEARLVDLLRERGKSFLSLVAIERERIVGHVAFSMVIIENAGNVRGAGLAPVGVDPAYQRRGIGSMLIREGVRRCAEADVQLVFLIGDPTYYTRFGFTRAKSHGFENEYGVDDEFMVLELQNGALLGSRGLVKYAPEFVDVS